MKPTITRARLVERRSDQRDVFTLVNQIRDGLLNRTGTYNFYVHTADASPVQLWQMDLARGTTLSIDAEIAAHSRTDGSAAVYKRFGAFKLVAGAVLSAQIGAVDSVDKEDVAAWDAVLSVDGNTGVLLQVVGDASRAIDWQAHIRCVEAPLEVFG